MASKASKIGKEKKEKFKKKVTPEQFKKANVAIHTASVAAGAAGFIPVPVADAIPISVAQITMVISLGKIFGKQVSESTAKAIIGAAASTFVGRNVVKVIPVVGWGISAAVAASITEAIGWMAALDFAEKTDEKNDSNDKASAKSTNQEEKSFDNSDSNKQNTTENNEVLNDKDEIENNETENGAEDNIENSINKKFDEED